MTIKHLQFQLQRNSPIHPIPNRGSNKHVGANAIDFLCKSGESCSKPAPVIGLWIAIKAAYYSTQFDRPNRNRLVIDASVIGVFPVAIVKTPNLSKGYGTKAVLCTRTPIAVIEVLALIEVIGHKPRIDPHLTAFFKAR